MSSPGLSKSCTGVNTIMAEVRLEDASRKARDLFEKGFAAMERGNLDYAIDMFLSVLDLEPGLLHARKFLRAAEIKKFKAGGGGSMAHTMSSVAGFGSVMSAKGLIKKKPMEGLKAAEKLLRKDPLNLQFILVLADAAEAADMPEVAIQTLVIAKEHFPANVKLLQRLGTFLLETNDTEMAHQVYEELLRLNPNDPATVKKYKDATALHTMNKGGWESEKDDFRSLLKNKDEAQLLEQEAKSVKSSGDLEALIESSKEKVAQEPGNINYVRALAELYIRDGRLNDAVASLEQAQAMTGGGDPQIDLMLSDIQIKRFEAEIADLENLGDTEGVATKKAALGAFRLQEAKDRVARYPNDLLFKYDLGLLLFEAQDITNAIQQFQSAQRNPQRRIMALYHLALCFKTKGQMDIAREQLQTALSELPTMDSTKKDVLYELGVLSEALGDRDGSLSYFKQIYAVDISYKDVAQKMEQFYESDS